MSDSFAGYGRPRAFACVIRERDQAELLVFDHPYEGVQIPKGRIDPGESPRKAAERELTEESGLRLAASKHLGRIETLYEHPDGGSTVREEWHIWMFEADPSVPDSWVHHPEEENLDFKFRWIALDESSPRVIHPHFHDVVERTLKQIEQMFGRGRSAG